jgi:Toxin YafO, type II toxin-antitoxin system
VPTFSTRALQAQLIDLGEVPDEWVRYFDHWVRLPEDARYGDYFFGKDSAYIKPLVGAIPYALRHVHLVPIANIEALRKWDSAHRRKGRKTSDRVLVYTYDQRGNHLLIFVLDEPHAHTIASMRTREGTETMNGFAAVAEAFIFDSSILA